MLKCEALLKVENYWFMYSKTHGEVWGSVLGWVSLSKDFAGLWYWRVAYNLLPTRSCLKQFYLRNEYFVDLKQESLDLRNLKHNSQQDLVCHCRSCCGFDAPACHWEYLYLLVVMHLSKASCPRKCLSSFFSCSMLLFLVLARSVS